MLVKITVTLIGNDFNKKAEIPSVPALNLVRRLEIFFFLFPVG